MIKLSLKFFAIIGITSVFFSDQLVTVTGLNYFSYIDEFFLLLLCLIACISLFIKKKVSMIVVVMSILTVAFITIGTISAIVNSNYNLEIVVLSGLLSSTFLIAVLCFLIIDIPEYLLEFILKTFEYIGFLSLFVACINMLLPSIYTNLIVWNSISYRYGIITPASIFEHPGTYGWFMMVMAAFYYSKYLSSKNKIPFLFFVLFTVFALFSMRAKVIGSLIITIIIGRFFNNKNWNIKLKYIFSSLILSSTILLVASDFLLYTYYHYFTFSGTEFTPRAAFNIYSVDILKNYFPLGVGFSKFGSHYARVYYSEYYYEYGMNYLHGMRPEWPVFGTDTFWPAIIGETGFIGVVIYISFLLIILMYLRKNINKCTDITIPLWAMIVFGQAIAESMGIQTFKSAPQNIVIAFIVAVALKSKESSSTKLKIKK